jgi:small subunit ribosomal protein S16
MLTIRLQRVGRKNDPSFRVVVVESKRAAKTGSFLEVVGSYDPRRDSVSLDKERISHWLKNGVTLSDTVHNLLVSQKIIDAKKINVLPKKTVAKAEEPAAEAAPAQEEAPAEAKAEESVNTDVAEETPAQ